MEFLDYFDVISSLAGLAAAIIAAVALIYSKKSQVNLENNNQNAATIEAFNYLQEQVLDKFVSYPKKEIWNLLDNIDEPKIKTAYDECRAMIAKIDHFAVGFNTCVYNQSLVNQLGGIHLIFLYEKVEPIIKHARKNQISDNYPYYYEFEKMINTLRKFYPELNK